MICSNWIIHLSMNAHAIHYTHSFLRSSNQSQPPVFSRRIQKTVYMKTVSIPVTGTACSTNHCKVRSPYLDLIPSELKIKLSWLVVEHMYRKDLLLQISKCRRHKRRRRWGLSTSLKERRRETILENVKFTKIFNWFLLHISFTNVFNLIKLRGYGTNSRTHLPRWWYVGKFSTVIHLK